MLSIIEQTPRKIQRTIDGWNVLLDGDHINIMTPSGQKIKLHTSQKLIQNPLIPKEVSVLTKNGMSYRTINIIGPTVPDKVRVFIETLKKYIVMR